MFRALKSFLGLDDEPKPAPRARLGCEALESRAMLDAKLVGSMLMVSGTGGHDTATVSEGRAFYGLGPSVIAVDLNGQKYSFLKSSVQNVYSNLFAGDDHFVNKTSVPSMVLGGDGDDYLRGGLASDAIYGGNGNDTIVSLDQAADQVYGDAGFDSFWLNGTTGGVTDALMNAEANEAGNTHRIGTFANGADLTLNGDDIRDPSDSLFTVRVDAPLFNPPMFGGRGFHTGTPSPNDIFQGEAGDCWLLSSLGATADRSPNTIRQTIVDLGDQTYAVELGGKFYRVDNELPVAGGEVTNGRYNLRFAQQGVLNSIWVPLVEKAYAHFRTGANTYASLDGGWMSEALTALGATDVDSKWRTELGGHRALNYIANEFANGRTVTMAFFDPQEGVPLVDQHAYMVDRVIRNLAGGVIAVVVRNPWGSDGVGDDGADDGYVTLTADMLNRTGNWVIESGKFA